MNLRNFSTFFIAILLTAFRAMASDTEVDGIYYDFDPVRKLATVTYRGYSYDSYEDEYSGDIVIPATVTYEGEEYRVYDIKEYAFLRCKSLTSVVIPDGLMWLGIGVFQECSSLTSVTIPEGLYSISGSAFSGCSSLTSVTIPESVSSISSEAFKDCKSSICPGNT